MEMYQTISISDRNDETDPNVHLISTGFNEKTTVEFIHDVALLIDWEIYESEGVPYWLERSTYSIPLTVIDKIAQIRKESPNPSPRG